MLILSSSEADSVPLATPWGSQLGIKYLGTKFLPIQIFGNIGEAIAACRRDLDSGLLSILVKQSDGVGIWRQLPESASINNAESAADSKAELASDHNPKLGISSPIDRYAHNGEPSNYATSDFLSKCERQLAEFIGPIASVIIKNTAAKDLPLAEFVNALIKTIPDRDRAEEFRISINSILNS